jgi:hypothetical protein
LPVVNRFVSPSFVEVAPAGIPGGGSRFFGTGMRCRGGAGRVKAAALGGVSMSSSAVSIPGDHRRSRPGIK